ncbi:MAG: aminoacetone oxidase family FAD-binding enzyme, partial [Candidatus Sericytochromatia bacterium]
NSWFCFSSEGKEFQANKVIISTGGLSIPKMGTDGKGHKILKNLGHKINRTYPALTPLKGIHPGNSMIAGISLDVQLTLKTKDKKNKKAEREGFLFTHKGFSGPSILDLSHYVIQAMETSDTKPVLTVNWNGFSEDKWRELLQPSKITLLNKLKEYIPVRLAEALCAEAKLEGRNLTDLKKEERNKLINILTQYSLNYTGHEGYEKAEVTGGGIPLEEINTATMESKLNEGLFVCGEILDVFGRIGGFNFYWAWLTGRLAGLNVSN